MERDAEQPLFGARSDLVGEVEQRAAFGAVDADDSAGLLEHPQRTVVARRGTDPGRAVQAGDGTADVEVVRTARLGGGLRRLQVLELVVTGQRGEAANGERGEHDHASRDEQDGATHRRAILGHPNSGKPPRLATVASGREAGHRVGPRGSRRRAG
jgi:hypothetical protein